MKDRYRVFLPALLLVFVVANAFGSLPLIPQILRSEPRCIVSVTDPTAVTNPDRTNLVLSEDNSTHLLPYALPPVSSYIPQLQLGDRVRHPYAPHNASNHPNQTTQTISSP